MPQDRTLKAIKSRSRSEQVSVVSLLLLPLLGMCCLLIPDTVTGALPYLLGGLARSPSSEPALSRGCAACQLSRSRRAPPRREPAVLGRVACASPTLGGVILVRGHASKQLRRRDVVPAVKPAGRRRDHDEVVHAWNRSPVSFDRAAIRQLIVETEA